MKRTSASVKKTLTLSEREAHLLLDAIDSTDQLLSLLAQEVGDETASRYQRLVSVLLDSASVPARITLAMKMKSARMRVPS